MKNKTTLNEAVVRPAVPSVANAISVLRFLGAQNGPRNLTAIARALKLSPSTCFNLLKTLTQETLIDFDAGAKHYRLGPGLVELARLSVHAQDIVQIAQPLMRSIADRYDAACSLWKRTADDRAVIVSVCESSSATRIHMTIGHRQPLFAGAVGKAYAAAMNTSANDIRDHFNVIKWSNRISLRLFQTQVRDAQKLGWATDNGNFIAGVTSVAAAIGDSRETTQYCLAATIFNAVHPESTLREVGQAVKSGAAEIARLNFDAGTRSLFR